ncbi:hypothetical protein LTR28_013235 [Elasticomyces elasticus]|nr:hypothetical protein LTR28_013235 [Elasticomyces elasticus]
MRLQSTRVLCCTVLGAAVVHAQFPPTPHNVTVIKSQTDPKISVSFKEAEQEKVGTLQRQCYSTSMIGTNLKQWSALFVGSTGASEGRKEFKKNWHSSFGCFFASTPELRAPCSISLTTGLFQSNVCETTKGVKSYAGYVTLPPNILNDLGEAQAYTINTFWWFFESRKDPKNAPLAIWTNGGPGASSMIGLLSKNGPCNTNPDSNSSTLNPWSWNNEVNMLYIDQPVQTGLSYDTLTNGTVDLTDSAARVTVADFSAGVPTQNNTFLVGTFPSQDINSTANGTANAARAIWHFAQVWFQTFPDYKPNDDRISIWTESYGSRYGPAFTAFFEEQNMKIANGTWKEAGAMHYLHLDTLGIVNGCIDLQVQEPSYAEMAYNNTYGIQAINQSIYNAAMEAYTVPGGTRDLIAQCRELATLYDSSNQGNNASVNHVCHAADQAANNLESPYIEYVRALHSFTA